MSRVVFSILGCLLLASCAAPAPPAKPSSAKPKPNGEQRLRDSLSHTKPQPRRK